MIWIIIFLQFKIINIIDFIISLNCIGYALWLKTYYIQITETKVKVRKSRNKFSLSVNFIYGEKWKLLHLF